MYTIVTGCNGFIGKYISSRLSNKVIPVDIHNCDALIKGADWRNVTQLIHLGAISDTTETDYEKIYKYNTDYTIKLFEWVSRGSIPITYASSASVYGNGDGPLNYYAMSKATIDMWVKDNMKRFGMIRGYRLFNVYGPGEDHKGDQASPIHKFVKQAKETGVIKIFDQDGDGERDFIHVHDVVKMMINDKRRSGIYDLGTGSTMKFSEIAKIVADKYNAEIEVVPFPNNLKGKYQHHTKSSIPLDGHIKVEDYINGLC
jgi:ADP-L-glycero-D-manno-heptose 6-epimerase